jgi:hypothetical protein
MGRAAGGPMSPGVPYRFNEHSGGPKEAIILGQQGHAVNNREASQAATPVEDRITILNVWSTDDVHKAMADAKGQRIIVNHSPGQKAQKR